MNILIIGFGSVGKGIYNYIRPQLTHEELIDKLDPSFSLEATQTTYDVIHITFPYLDEIQFFKDISEHLHFLHSKTIVIIHSTINPAFLYFVKRFEKGSWYYCPTRIREDNMIDGFFEKDYRWFIALIVRNNGQLADNYIKMCKIKPVWFYDSFALAYGKLLETTWTGMQIAFAQIAKIDCDKYGWNFEEAYTLYTRLSIIGDDYTQKHQTLLPRPVFFPGHIEGKCVMQNIKLLENGNLSHPRLIQFIQDSNQITAYRLRKEQNDPH